MVRMMQETLPGEVSFGGIDLATRVRALLLSVNALVNNNNGFSCSRDCQPTRNGDLGITG
jgi:hypothetical protein